MRISVDISSAGPENESDVLDLVDDMYDLDWECESQTDEELIFNNTESGAFDLSEVNSTIWTYFPGVDFKNLD